MKKLLMAVFVLMWFLPFALAQLGTPASRRYAEKTPLQFSFGSFSAIAPFNSSSGYTVVPTTNQLQPSGLIIDSNNFASTADFTACTNSTLPTFTVSGNVGSFTTGSGGGGGRFWDTKTSYSFATPVLFSAVTINQLASSGEMRVAIQNNIGSGTCNTTGLVELIGDYWTSGPVVRVLIEIGGSTNIGCSSSIALPTPPFQLGVSLLGNEATVWYNVGSGWVAGCSADVSSSYNFETSGNLTGFKTLLNPTGMSGATTWQVSNLSTGAFGGVGIRGVRVVTYPDGRPYMQGPLIYFVAGLQSFNNATSRALFSYNVSTGALTQISVIASQFGTVVNPGDSSGSMIYNPATGDELFMVGNINTSPHYFYYGAYNTSTLNVFTPGSYVLTGMTQMTLSLNSSQGISPDLVCSKWNYSSGTCSEWLFALVSGTTTTTCYPALFSSSSDPGSNSWTLVGDDSSSTGYEGAIILRTATGSSGVQYFPSFAGVVGSSTRTSRVYSSAMSFLGAINFTPPAGSLNPTWTQIFSYGNTEYMLTHNDSIYGTDNSTTGNLIVTTAPKY